MKVIAGQAIILQANVEVDIISLKEDVILAHQ